ncbi:MAG: 1-aminocyclopropane-1-carboxylate deaminase/D-cysteine desulfhydrase [Methylovulum sp.]|nr:MAG: 1-aminocyclopropane-1-carboxylate deaminase/D-cysteine desulfhydrase [Methylovulum sp.]
MQPKLIALEKTFNASTLTKLDDAVLERQHIELWIKRDDLLHPVISGNKWRKLKYILDDALSLGCDTLISMGGAYSNHLHALAYAGKALGLHTTGLIRGECPKPLTPTLQDMHNWGMQLEFISRSDYRQLRCYQGRQDLPGIRPGQYWIPEGGAQPLALAGIAELVSEITLPYDVLCVPCGTGTTLAGIIKAAPVHASIIGYPVLKHAGFLISDLEKMLDRPHSNWQLKLDYHFGGFAKTNAALIAFVNDFETKTGIPIEPVYTGKMLYAIYDLIAKQYFKPGLKMIAVHTGGLQGKRGFS